MNDSYEEKTCLHCKRPVDPGKQRKGANGFFCSIRCQILHHLSRFGSAIKNATKQLIGMLISFFHHSAGLFRNLRRVSFRMLLDIMFTFGIIACLIISILLYLKILHFDQKIDSLAVQKKIAEQKASAKHPGLKILSPHPNAMVNKSQITITGEAEKNTIVSLQCDSAIIAVTLPENGIFRFEDIDARRGQNTFLVKALTSDGEANTIQEIHFTYFSPTLAYLSRNYERGDIHQNKIALTFDGDYLDNAADPILDCLMEKKVACTFFLTGRFIERYSQTVSRLIREGHEIGNHTWSHPHLTTFEENHRHETRQGVNRELIQEQLMKTERLLEESIGIKMTKIWRAPYGEHNHQIRLWAAEAGYRQVGWTIGKNWRDSMDTLDWVADKNSNTYLTAEEIYEKVMLFGSGDPNGANGCIVLMHLGTKRLDDFPYSKLPDIIDGLRQRNYELVRITELLE
ncbi:polysaccharide deacetylase family protein [candidate division KSB1 bacterium]|nr:polysaccharide deacetylase family protein [candidate division KSB1 bacterium]